MKPYGLKKSKTRYVSSWCACGVCGNLSDWHPPHERRENKHNRILVKVDKEYGEDERGD